MSTEQTVISTGQLEKTTPIITRQVQDGCVTASARSLFGSFDVPFETQILPLLQEYQLDPRNSENNHMLGVAVVAARLGFDVAVHIKPKFSDYTLPDSVSQRVREIHKQLLQIIDTFSKDGRILLMGGGLRPERI